MYTLSCGHNGFQQPPHWGYFHTANSSPLPSSHLRTLSSSIQPLPTVVVAYFRLGSAGQWHWLFCSSSGLAATNHLLHSPLMLWGSPSVLADLPTSEGPSRIQEPLFSHSSFLGAQVLSWFFFYFLPTQLHGDFLALSAAWDLLPVFSRYPMRTVLHIDVFFMYLGEKVSFTSY